MKVFLLAPLAVRGNYTYESLWPNGEADWDDFWDFGCIPKTHAWDSRKAVVRVSEVDEPAGDFPYLTSGCLVLGERALAIAREHLVNCGELLPLSCLDGRSFTIFHPMPCYECIDQELTRGTRFDDGRWMIIERYCFLTHALPAVPVFKITDMPTKVFCSTEFKAIVESAGLKGLKFREVWNDDGDPVETTGWFDSLK